MILFCCGNISRSTEWTAEMKLCQQENCYERNFSQRRFCVNEYHFFVHVITKHLIKSAEVKVDRWFLEEAQTNQEIWSELRLQFFLSYILTGFDYGLAQIAFGQKKFFWFSGRKLILNAFQKFLRGYWARVFFFWGD